MVGAHAPPCASGTLAISVCFVQTHQGCLGTDLPEITDSSYLLWAVSNLSNTSEAFLVCPSVITGMQEHNVLLSDLCKIKSRHQRIVISFLFFFACPMHVPSCRPRCPCCRLPASCREAHTSQCTHPQKSRTLGALLPSCFQAERSARLLGTSELPSLTWAYLKAGWNTSCFFASS